MTTHHPIARAAWKTTAVALSAAVSMALASTASAHEAPTAPTVPTSSATSVSDYNHPHTPAVVRMWASAWNSGDSVGLGALFTADGRYTDHAFDATFTGPNGVEEWVTLTTAGIKDPHAEVRWAYRYDQTIVFGWTFTGQINSAPSAFAVPAVTVLHMSGSKIASNDDYYSRADVLAQSGLPADWQPEP